MPALLQAVHPNNSFHPLTLFPPKLIFLFFLKYFSLFFFRTLCCLVPSVLVEPVYYVAPTYCNYYYNNNAFMAVRFAFVSADTNAIPADTNAIQRMLGYPYAPMKSVAFMIVIASSGRISFPLHAWPPGSRLCQLTQTRYQLTQTRYGAC